MLPFLVKGFEVLLAVPVLVQITANEADNEVAVLVHDVFAAAAGDVDAVAVEQTLWDEGEFGKDGGVPLDDVFLSEKTQPLACCSFDFRVDGGRKDEWRTRACPSAFWKL